MEGTRAASDKLRQGANGSDNPKRKVQEARGNKCYNLKIRSSGEADQGLKSPRACPAEGRQSQSHKTGEHGRSKLTKAGMPNFLQPSISSVFPVEFDVMNTTSAFQSL